LSPRGDNFISEAGWVAVVRARASQRAFTPAARYGRAGDTQTIRQVAWHSAQETKV